MRYTTKSKRQVRVVTLDGTEIGTAFEADTTEGWLKVWVRGFEGGPGVTILVDRKEQEMVSLLVHTSYRLIDCRTGDLVADVRWSMSKPPVLTVTENPSKE